MGAHDFETYAFGRDASDAFGNAVKDAVYDRGHDPYNGTISTVGTFHLVTLPKQLKLRDFIDLCWELHDGDEPTKPPIRRAFKAEWDRREHEDAKRRWRIWSKLDREAQIRVREGARFEKWDVCTAVQVTGTLATKIKKERGWRLTRSKVFVFFGLAAC